MIHAILKIRLKQLYRGSIGIGLIRILFVIALLTFIVLVLFNATSKYPESLFVSGITSLVLFLMHSSRPDKPFLKTNFEFHQLIFLVEYLLGSSIVIAFLMFHFQWIPLFILLSAILLIIHFDIKTKNRSQNSGLQRLIPSACFEWKSGVRRSFYMIIPIWTIGLLTSFFVGSVPVTLFILGVIPLSFYEKGEPYQMIIAFEKGTNQFLWHKIKMQILLYSVLSLPLIVAFLVFHHKLWYIAVIEYLIFSSLFVFLILTKYAFYEPNSKSSSAQIFGAIGTLAGIIPLFLPLVWIMSIRFYFKSKENLNFYLNDFN